jgi:hypothetical protein
VTRLLFRCRARKPRNVVGRIVSISLDHFIPSRMCASYSPASKFGPAGGVHVLH